jgi:hypothetical protein
MLRKIHRLTTFQHHNLLLCHTDKPLLVRPFPFRCTLQKSEGKKKKKNFKN